MRAVITLRLIPSKYWLECQSGHIYSSGWDRHWLRHLLPGNYTVMPPKSVSSPLPQVDNGQHQKHIKGQKFTSNVRLDHMTRLLMRSMHTNGHIKDRVLTCRLNYIFAKCVKRLVFVIERDKPRYIRIHHHHQRHAQGS